MSKMHFEKKASATSERKVRLLPVRSSGVELYPIIKRVRKKKRLHFSLKWMAKQLSCVAYQVIDTDVLPSGIAEEEPYRCTSMRSPFMPLCESPLCES